MKTSSSTNLEFFCKYRCLKKFWWCCCSKPVQQVVMVTRLTMTEPSRDNLAHGYFYYCYLKMFLVSIVALLSINISLLSFPSVGKFTFFSLDSYYHTRHKLSYVSQIHSWVNPSCYKTFSQESIGLRITEMKIMLWLFFYLIRKCYRDKKK